MHRLLTTLTLTLLLFQAPAWAAPTLPAAFCDALAKKLRTVTLQGCRALSLTPSGHYSHQGWPLAERHIHASQHPSTPERILFIGGIHGDEWAAVSLAYLWLQNLIRHQNQLKNHWLVVPVANPDGLFKRPSTRTNARGVDINRNFPSPDWQTLALDWWQRYKRKNPRYYPGPNAASEPETRYLVSLIKHFQPTIIIALHAPYRLLDYDGPHHITIPEKIGSLKLRQLGTYPGSLGRYAGEYLKIPVVTIELKSARRMPSAQEIESMWHDLNRWIDKIHTHPF